jgi:hypothetical protein
MQVFRDKQNQDWTVELSAGQIVRIRAESEGRFDLFDPIKGELATQLADDLPACWEALWFVCSAQARARNITADKFGELLADDALLDGQAALFRAWKDFFLRLRRPELALVVEKAGNYQAKKVELVKAKLADPMLANLDDRVSRAMEEKLNGSFGSLGVSLDAILGPSPSASSTECAADATAPPAP